MTPHIHAELIKAWADGSEIEGKYKYATDNEWTFCRNPNWLSDYEYRIKTQPKKRVMLYQAVMKEVFNTKSATYCILSGLRSEDNWKEYAKQYAIEIAKLIPIIEVEEE